MLNWDTTALARIEAEHKKNLARAAIHLKAKCREYCNRPQEYERTKGPKGVHYKGLDPSQPGEFPKRVIGDLVRSIAHEPAPDKLNWKVGTASIVGLYLEFGTRKMAARPWLSQTLLLERDNIMRILEGGTAT